MWEYNPMTNTWKFVEDLPEGGFYGAAATAIGKKIVTFGGYNQMGIRRKLQTFCTEDPNARWIDNAISDGDPPPTAFANLVTHQSVPSNSMADLFLVAGEVLDGQGFKLNPMTSIDREFVLPDDCRIGRPELAEEQVVVPEPVTSAPAAIVTGFVRDKSFEDGAQAAARATAILVFGGRTATGSATDRAFALVLAEVSGPDLTGEWEALTQRCGGAAQKCKLKGSFVVRNVGVEETPASTLSYYLSSDETLDEGDLLLKQQQIAGVPAGRETRVAVKKVKLPAGTSGTGMFVIAVLDDGDGVTESDEGNNLVVFGPL
jgi:hypothetical protein